MSPKKIIEKNYNIHLLSHFYDLKNTKNYKKIKINLHFYLLF